MKHFLWTGRALLLTERLVVQKNKRFKMLPSVGAAGKASCGARPLHSPFRKHERHNLLGMLFSYSLTLFYSLVNAQSSRLGGATGFLRPKELPAVGCFGRTVVWQRLSPAYVLKAVSTTLFLLATSSVYGQFYAPNETTLRIGDRVPESFWTSEHAFVDMQSDSLYRADLSSYSDKLLILDFWASWCGPCIGSLQKLASLRQAYPDVDFEVLPVAYEKFDPIWGISRKIQEYRWPFHSIVQDSVLGPTFPHISIPHMVWIYKGEVIAKPKWDYATIENIELVMAGEKPKLINTSQDWAIDLDKPFFTAGNGDTEVLYEQEGVKIGRYIPEYQTELAKVLYHEGKTFMYAINMPLSHIYYEAFKDAIHSPLDWRAGSGVFWGVSEGFREQFLSEAPQKSVVGDMSADLRYHDWVKDNLYSFVIERDGEVDEELMRSDFQQHLNACFQNLLGLYAELMPMKMLRYATLRSENLERSLELLGKPVKGKQPRIEQKDGQQRYGTYRALTMRTMKYLSSLLDDELDYSLMQDSTGIAPNHLCDFIIPKYSELNKAELQALLGRFGLYFTIENKKVPVLFVQQVSKDYQP